MPFPPPPTGLIKWVWKGETLEMQNDAQQFKKRERSKTLAQEGRRAVSVNGRGEIHPIPCFEIQRQYLSL